jgi:hypothetical protein
VAFATSDQRDLQLLSNACGAQRGVHVVHVAARLAVQFDQHIAYEHARLFRRTARRKRIDQQSAMERQVHFVDPRIRQADLLRADAKVAP